MQHPQIASGAYVLHLSLDALVRQAQEAQRLAGSPLTMYLSWYSRRNTYHGIPESLDTTLALSWLDPATGVIHGAHIPVERVSLLTSDEKIKARQQAAGRRAQRAWEIVHDAITHANLQVAEGQLLTAGMREDLQRIETSHELWTWDRPTDEDLRLIVMAERPEGGAR